MDAVLLSSASCRWNTPPGIQAEWRAFFGGDYYDPCPATDGPPLVDGLSVDWVGDVAVNPPFSRKEKMPIEPWVLKWRRSPFIREGLLLVPSRTGSHWFQPLFQYPICFFEGRLHFSGHPNGATFDTALVYRGDRPAAFAEAFGHHGAIMLAAWPRKSDAA